jgi:uncharacterized protein YcnI
MKRTGQALLIGTAISLTAAIVDAHIEVASGPGFANTSQEITFGVGHGCSGMDTVSVKIDIPAGVTSVRTETSDFGKATVEKDMAGTVIAVTWTKPDADLLDSDTAYYKLTLRLKVPNAPFTTIFFPAHQTCKGPDGGTAVTDWIATMPSPDGGGPEPAPALRIVPARVAGWNKFTVPAAIADLSVHFKDALIVWKGTTAAYSSNPVTADLITKTAGVTALTSLAANDEIWVKY